MSLKYAIVPFPIPEGIIKSGVIAQTQTSAVKNNSRTSCIVSYANSFNARFAEYPSFETADDLKKFKEQDPKEWDASYIAPITEVIVDTSPAFSSKHVVVNGDTKSLFKRVHGVELTIPANSTGFLDFKIPYPICKFTGAEILGTDLGDSVDFFVLDNDYNSYSSYPVINGIGNFPLNQFGFDVRMPGGSYTNTSNYDADLYYSMELSCAYKNNTNSEKTIYVNFEIHEVK